MNGRVLYDTVALTQGHADMMTGAGAFDDHQRRWSNVVNETVMSWLSKDGATFGDVNEMFRQANMATNQFLSDLATAVARCSANADDTLAYCTNLVNG
jgi:hypothetical protein